jgi:hypothetical protein
MSAYANRAINDFQRKKKLAKALSENEYQLVQMNSAEFVELYISHKQKQGMTRADTVENLGIIISQSSPIGKQFWDKHNAKIKTGSGLIPLMTDVVALSALAIEMKRGGSAFSAFKTVTYSGQPYVVFQGYARLRRDLTGSRYLANNPKVVSLGIGKLGALNTITKGGVVTIIISAVFHFVDQLMNDKKTWHHFVGGMAVDISIALGTMAITWAGVLFLGTVATITIGALSVVVVVGTFLGIASSMFIDTNYWVDRTVEILVIIEINIESTSSNLSFELSKIENQYKNKPLQFFYNLLSIPYFGQNNR